MTPPLADQSLVNRVLGGVLVADALRTLASCTTAAGDGARASALHDEADAAYRNAGVRHLARDPDSTPAIDGRRSGDNEWCRDGDVWRVAYSGTTTIVKHSKGMADLAALLSRPGREGARDRVGRRPGGGARHARGGGARPVGGRRRTGSGSATSPPTSTRPTPTTTPVGRREPAPSTTPSSTS